MEFDTCLVNRRDPGFKSQHHKKEEKKKDRKGGEERGRRGGEEREGRKKGKERKKGKRKWLKKYCSSDGGYMTKKGFLTKYLNGSPVQRKVVND